MALALLAAVAFAAALLVRGKTPPPEPPGSALRVEPLPPDSGVEPLPVPMPAEQPAPPRDASSDPVPPEAMRAYVVERLDAILPESHTLAERERLADLILEAAGARLDRGEPPAVAREIELAIAEEFEALAGMRLGDAVSLLTPPEQGAARPPRSSPPAGETDPEP